MNSQPLPGAAGAPIPGRRPPAPALARGEAEEILGLIADEVRILLPSWSNEDRSTGGDLDCAVQGIDPLWPLRLDPRTKLRQCLEYDIGARFWILERNGSVFAIDTIDDPHGLGRYAFPTAPLFDESGLVPPAGARAAYRTVKRLRKGIRDVVDWRETAALALEDVVGFDRLLIRLLGPDIARTLSGSVLRGVVPSDRLARAVRLAVARRRIGSPRYALAPALRLRRVLRRVRQPTGLLVTVVGPDGSGKSTLARSLPGACRGLFRREALFHWRPAMLPRPSTLIGATMGDPSSPHERESHSRAVSTALLLYYWADFFVGSWTRFLALRVRTGLVIVERGWWDILVDPRRYRLDAPPMLVKMLGNLLPAPDLTLVCEAPVEVLLDRKSELTSEELSRQTYAWRSLRINLPRAHFLDGSAPLADVRDAARTLIADHLESRTISRLGYGWASLALRTRNRWSAPRGPARIALSSLSVYQPMTLSRRAAWELARVVARSGSLRFLPRSDPAPRAVREKIAPLLPRRGSFAVARANHRGRFLVLVLNEQGEPQLFVKVATNEHGSQALGREALQIEELGSLLRRPLRPPEIVERGEGLVAYRAERWRARWSPWRLDEDMAASLGAFFAGRQRLNAEGLLVGLAHGDVAPWNLLETDQGWVLIDWEYASTDMPAFYDIFHHLVQSHVLLHRPSRRALLSGVSGAGPIAPLLRTYARAAGVDVGLAPELLCLYAKLSAAHLDPGQPDGRLGLAVRNELTRGVGSRP